MKNMPVLIREALEKAMKSTDGDWQFSKSGKKNTIPDMALTGRSWIYCCAS